MQMIPLVSIIIPVYNVEKYIDKCLNSILAQTYNNWETVLVDDGSPDSSGTICDKYASKDKRFKVIHKKNGGVSTARQTGLDNATGDYIIHCDPDDWVEPTMIQQLVDAAIKENAGMVICDITEIDNKKTNTLKQNLDKEQTSTEVQAEIINQRLHGSCCNKLIKKEFCKNTKFYPSHINMCEDELYNLRVLAQKFKVIYLPKALYFYNKNNCSSVCSSKAFKSIESRMTVIDECEMFIDSSLHNNFFAMKRSILQLLLEYKFTNLLPTTYPEIHHEILSNGAKYNFFLPLSYFLAMAVNGKPKTAYYLYKTNITIIEWLKSLKHLLFGKK